MTDVIQLSDFAAAPQPQGAPQQDLPRGHVSLEDFAGPAPVQTAASAPPESTYTFTSLGPLNGPANAVHGFTEQMGRAATLGLQDKVGALVPAIRSLVDQGWNALTGNSDAQTPSISDAYHQELTRERNAGETYAQNHPIASKVASTIGTVASLPATGTAGATGTLGSRVVEGIKQGATIGGLSGFGGSNDQSLGQTAFDTAQGAGVGATLGAVTPVVAEKVVQPVIDMVARRYGSGAVDNQAVRQITQRIQQDASAGGPTAQDMLDALSAASSGKPLTIADVAGQNVKGMGERIANTPGPGQQVIAKTLNDRDVAAGTRLAGDVNANLGAGSAYDTTQALMDARSAAAKPAYDVAMSAEKIDSPRLQEFLSDPVLKSGLAKGVETQRLEALAKGEPFNPDDYTLIRNPEGIPVGIQGVPNMRTLDAGKRGLDAQIAEERNPITGRLSQRGVALDQVRQAYVAELDKLNPDYAAARASWAGPSQSMDAVRSGQAVFNKRPEEIAAEFGKLAPGDQEFYRLGAADAIKEKIAKTGMGGDEAKKIIGNQYTQNQLRPLFPDQASYDRFVKAATDENTMFNTRYDTLGNSKTFRRSAEAANAAGGEGGLAGAIGQAVAGAATGEPVISSLGAFNAAKNIYGRLAQPNPQVDLQAAKMLFTTDPATNRQTLARLLAAQNQPSRLPLATFPLASIGARAVPQLEQGYSPQGAR